MKEFNDLVKIMKRLRNECPWDKEQSLSSLRTFLLEESYEVLDAMNLAISENKFEALVEELGDLLLQVLFQSEIISEHTHSKLDISSVLKELQDKLVRRHPHVFGESQISDSAEVLRKWDEIKASEKPSQPQSVLDEVPRSMTALQRATKFGKKAKKLRFDWQNSEEVWTKCVEEINELQEAKSSTEKEEELGDLLFCLAQWARHEGIDPEAALASANTKFESRFKQIERHPDFEKLELTEKEKLWAEVKKLEQQKTSSNS